MKITSLRLKGIPLQGPRSFLRRGGKAVGGLIGLGANESSPPDALAGVGSNRGPSLINLPPEINSIVVSYLDHESLTRLGTTCSQLSELVLHNSDSAWKALHDGRWIHGKRRFDGPPSQRPRNGRIAIVLDGLSWREEFVRRFSLDKMVPQLLEGDMFQFYSLLRQNQGDIYNKLMDIRGEFSDAYLAIDWLNALEVVADMESLLRSDVVTTYDVEMIRSKARHKHQSCFWNISRSPDEIYDTINRELDALEVESPDGFEVVGGEDYWPLGSGRLADGEQELLDLWAVLQSRRGCARTIDLIRSRLNGNDEVVDSDDAKLIVSMFKADVPFLVLGCCLGMENYSISNVCLDGSSHRRDLQFRLHEWTVPPYLSDDEDHWILTDEEE